MPQLPQPRIAFCPLFILSLALSSGILLRQFLGQPVAPSLTVTVLLGVALTGLAALLVWQQKMGIALVTLTAGFALAGFALKGVDDCSVSSDRLFRMFEDGLISTQEPIELTGVVQGEPEQSPDGFYLKLRAQHVRIKQTENDASGDILLLAHLPSTQIRLDYQALALTHGTLIRVLTTLERDEEFRNPGVSPFTEYLERKGYDGVGVIKSPLLIERLGDEPVFLPLAWLYEWREELGHRFDQLFDKETSGVLQAALLGNPYNISSSAADRFRAGGTFHVLVISGMQISFIAGLVILIVNRLTRRRFLRVTLATLFLWAYTIAVGAEAAVARSAIMFSLMILAPLFWRRANSWNTIGGAALTLLVWRPGNLLDPSFQLTFLSVLAIVAFAVPVLDRLNQIGSWRPTRITPFPPDCAPWIRGVAEALFWNERKWRAEMSNSNVKYRLFKAASAKTLERWHLQRGLRFGVSAIVVSTSVQVCMLPLLILYFHRLSIAALLLNIFVGALMAALSTVALIAVLFVPISAWLASCLAILTNRIEWLMVHLVDPFNRIAIASIRLPHYTGWPSLIYILYFVPLVLLSFTLARCHPLRPASIPGSTNKLFSFRKVALTSIAFAIFFILIIFHPFSASGPDGRLHLDFLDVGQGDSALVTMPDGTTLLIDGGGRPNFNRNDSEPDDAVEVFERDRRSIGEAVVSEYLWARGFDRIDYILATHADADHIDGLNDVARNFRVRGAIVARTPGHDPEFRRFAATMKDIGVPIQQVGAGDSLNFGNCLAEVLWPSPTADRTAASRNNDSIVLRLHLGERTFLLTGDLERDGEAAVLREGIDLRSDVVKVAHHGSRTSSTAEFVKTTQTRLAVISVGRRSIYGHPNREVLERWGASGAEVMTTGEQGTISLITDGHNLSVSTFVRK